MAGSHIPILGTSHVFPPHSQAGPEGLLAVGGDLEPERLLLAYRTGIFPWFSDDAMIMWWSPDPRMVLFPEALKVSKSMRRLRASDKFRITKNTCFDLVIAACAGVARKEGTGTWITPGMAAAYSKLHKLGHAHSYEVWEDGELAGGLYGVDIGTVFCGESMFSRVSNASKAGFIQMVLDMRDRGCRLIDCQVYTAHLASLGAVQIPRSEFLDILSGHHP